MESTIRPIKGRGAASNREGRYERLRRVPAQDGWTQESLPPRTRTTVEVDASRSIISSNESPDLHFDRSINMYRGCEHGCTYCYARPTHSYLGYSPGLDFETRLLVKPDAAQLLRREISRKSYACATIALGTNTDPYQPIEKTYALTRQLLEVFLEHRHPVTITTKSHLIVRDLDVLGELASHNLVSVSVSVTTLDNRLAQRMEPRASAPHRRIEAIRRLSEAGIPITILLAPVILGLNDHELEAVVAQGRHAGAVGANWILLRLPLEVKDLFYEWLEQHYPLKVARVQSLMRQSRDGADNDSQFHRRFSGSGPIAQMFGQRFRAAAKKNGLNLEPPCLDTGLFRKKPGTPVQGTLF